MLFKNTIKILDLSKEKDIDIYVAKNLCLSKNDSINNNNVNKAYEFIIKYYTFITKCRINNNISDIEKLCILYENNDYEGINKFIKM